MVGTTFTPGTQPEQAAGTDTAADLRYQHWDLRSVRLVTNGSGNQVDTQSHDAFGEVMDAGSASLTFFTTYEREQTGLDYARARYYRSDHKRFTSPDRYRGSYRLGSPQSLNRYAYVANDPVNRIDPTGQEGCFLICTFDESTEQYTNCEWTCAITPTLGGNQVIRETCDWKSFNELPRELQNMLGSAERWNSLSDEARAALLGIAAKMLVAGLGGFFFNLQIQWCTGGNTTNCDIQYGKIYFTGTGVNQMWEAFTHWLSDSRNPMWRLWRLSDPLQQVDHPGFLWGVRENTGSASGLHISFNNPQNPTLIEVHIDPHGGFFHHAWDRLKQAAGETPPNTGEIFALLMNDPSVGPLLRGWMKCTGSGGGRRPLPIVRPFDKDIVSD